MKTIQEFYDCTNGLFTGGEVDSVELLRMNLFQLSEDYLSSVNITPEILRSKVEVEQVRGAITTAIEISSELVGIPVTTLSMKSVGEQVEKEDAACVVMHSAQYHDMIKGDIADRITNVADLVVHNQEGIGKVVVLDASSILDSPVLLPKGCLKLELTPLVDKSDGEDFEFYSSLLVGVRGYKYIGEDNPTYIQLHDKNNWIKINERNT